MIREYETANLNILRPFYYFKQLLTELPKLRDDKGNIDPTKSEVLLPWSTKLPKECGKPLRQKSSGVIL